MVAWRVFLRCIASILVVVKSRQANRCAFITAACSSSGVSGKIKGVRLEDK